jgi:hypothetical protein
MRQHWIVGAAAGAMVIAVLWLVLARPGDYRVLGQPAGDPQAPKAGKIAFDPRGSDPMLAGRIGEQCIVYFRRDRLGLAASKLNEILSVDAASSNNTSVYVSGTLVRVNTAWICLAGSKNKEYTIPTDVILLVEVNPKDKER